MARKYPTGIELHYKLHEIAKSRGGVYLTNNGENTTSSQRGEFLCDKGHRTGRRNLNTLYGRWCTICNNENVTPEARLSVEEVNNRIAPLHVRLKSNWISGDKLAQFECTICESMWEERGKNQTQLRYGCITCIPRLHVHNRTLLHTSATKTTTS